MGFDGLLGCCSERSGCFGSGGVGFRWEWAGVGVLFVWARKDT